METEQIPEDHGHKKGRHRKKQLYNSILQQMEFYFSDSNLTKDRFLSQLIESDPNIDISIFLKFNKLRKITTSIEDIAKAIRKSELIQLSEDKTKVCRKVPVKVKQDVEECTIYVERLKSDATHDWLKAIFSEFGNVVYVSIPKYKHNGIIKGFAFVEFENAEGAQAAMKYFESIDCNIPSDLEPQKLCSIATYDPNEKNDGTNKFKMQKKRPDGETDEQGQENENGRKVKEEETANEDVQKPEEPSKCDGDPKTKKKRKHSKSEANEGQEIPDQVQHKKLKVETAEDVLQKKRKHSETETNEAVEASNEDKRKLKIEDEAVEASNEGKKKLKTEDKAVEASNESKKKLKIEDEAETNEAVEASKEGKKKLKIEDEAKTNEAVKASKEGKKKLKSEDEAETNEAVKASNEGKKKLKMRDEAVEASNEGKKKLKMDDETVEASNESKKKLKIEDEAETNETVESSKEGKEKLKTEDEAVEVSNEGKKKLKIEDQAETNESVQLEAVSDAEGEEKKKKKHKKSNRKKVNLKEIGLQILSKKDWKKMRNRYLDMQKKTMKQLKMHLNRQKFSNRYGNKRFHSAEHTSSEMEVVKESNGSKESDTAKAQSQFLPGTIVKVSLSEPCENNKKLKSEFQELSTEIKYVDIPWKIGSEEVYIRFSDNENAKTFCNSNFSKGKLCILEGDEEKIYWDKIETSRQEKQKKMVGKQRGRDKLLKKAERQAAKHVRFDDNNSE